MTAVVKRHFVVQYTQYIYTMFTGVFWGPEELNDNCVETKHKGNNGYIVHFNSKLKDA